MANTKKDLVCDVMIHVAGNVWKKRQKYRGGYLNTYFIKGKCIVCGEDAIRCRNNKGWNLTCSRKCHTISCVNQNNKKYGGINRTKLKSSGHVLRYCPQHPNAVQGFVPEHRLIIEKQLGRLLLRTELIHHIDCDKANNSIDNLCLNNTQTEHHLTHGSLNKCVKALLGLGVLIFDKESKTYKTK